MLKSEVGESRRGAVFHLPSSGHSQVRGCLERLSGLILGDFLAKMGDLSDFSS